MNKYVLRTSLVWFVAVALVSAFLLYRHRVSAIARLASGKSSVPNSQPAATGPNATTGGTSESQPRVHETPLAPVQLTPERMQSIGVKIGTARYKLLTDDIRASGTVDIDERLVSYVQVRFPGYIRRVFANATYQYVRKGEPLFTVYSPELVATQQEYLLARQNEKELSGSSVDGVASGASSLTTAAEQRLEQWEVPQSELRRLRETGKPLTELTINSSVSGYITERNVLPNMYIEPATHLYTIADLSRVWVYAQVFQNDVGRLKSGDSAQITVDSYPGKTFSGRIEDILPQVDLTTRTVRVRIAVSNPGLKLKPGMFVNVDLKSTLGRRLVVPASAVFRSGTRDLLFLYDGNGNLNPREVTIGPQSGDDVVVLQGVHAGQQIVTSANFLIDSESQLQAAAGSFVPPPPGAGNAAQQTGTPPAAQVAIAFTTSPDPPRKGSNTFRVRLTDLKNAPVTGAEVTVNFFMAAMPAMGMAAMNTTSTLSEKGGGFYEGTGALASGGTWQVSITAQKNGQTIATRQLRVNATGGM